MKLEVESHGPEETERLARRLAERLGGGELIALTGDLGSGKTTFVRGLAAGVGADPRAVRSPSYAIHHRYSGGRLVLEHLDAYFVREEEEFERVGLFEWLEAGHVAVVEWADRFASLLGRADLRVALREEGPTRRRLEIEARGAGRAAIERVAAAARERERES